MMARQVPEWIGKTDNTPIPIRVRIRLYEAHGWRCCRCNRMVNLTPDHRIALVNGGENRESNLQPLCSICHKDKTATDVKIKAKTARIHRRRAGIKKRGRSLTSKTLKRKVDGTVVRR
jgi:5-methylcytosine-specific restriction protein A